MEGEDEDRIPTPPLISAEVIGREEERETGTLTKRAEKLSIPVLGKLEKSKIISFRAKRLFEGERPLMPTEQLVSADLEKIAEQEFNEGFLNDYILIRRPFSDGTYEDWRIDEFKYQYSC